MEAEAFFPANKKLGIWKGFVPGRTPQCLTPFLECVNVTLCEKRVLQV